MLVASHLEGRLEHDAVFGDLEAHVTEDIRDLLLLLLRQLGGLAESGRPVVGEPGGKAGDGVNELLPVDRSGLGVLELDLEGLGLDEGHAAEAPHDALKELGSADDAGLHLVEADKVVSDPDSGSLRTETVLDNATTSSSLRSLQPVPHLRKLHGEELEDLIQGLLIELNIGDLLPDSSEKARVLDVGKVDVVAVFVQLAVVHSHWGRVGLADELRLRHAQTGAKDEDVPHELLVGDLPIVVPIEVPEENVDIVAPGRAVRVEFAEDL